MRRETLEGTSRKTKVLSKLQKPLIFFILILLFLFAVKDSLPDVMDTLTKTSLSVVIAAMLSCCIYHVIEGRIIHILAKHHRSDYPLTHGIGCAFYGSFYRVVTFGSGSGVASIHYLNQTGVPVANGTGMTITQYILHKISISLFSAVFFLINRDFLYQHHSGYFKQLLLCYGATILVSVFLLTICMFHKCHFYILLLCKKLDRKNKYEKQIEALEQNLNTLRTETTLLITNKKLIVKIIIMDCLKLFFFYAIPCILNGDLKSLNLIDSLTLTSFTAAVAGIIPTPAGIGSTEFVFTLLFTPVLGRVDAISIGLLYRFITYIFPCIPGIFAVLFYKRSVPHGSKK